MSTARRISGAEYERRVRALEAEGMTRSDAQGIADADLLKAGEVVDWQLRDDAPPAVAPGAALQAFGAAVLGVLECDLEWSGDTLQAIADSAVARGLTDKRASGSFVVAPAFREACGLPAEPLHGDLVFDDGCPDDPDGQHHVGCGCDGEDPATTPALPEAEPSGMTDAELHLLTTVAVALAGLYWERAAEVVDGVRCIDETCADGKTWRRIVDALAKAEGRS
jgi:hypothetical protein